MKYRTLCISLLATLASASMARAQTVAAPDTSVAAVADTAPVVHTAIASSMDQTAAVHRDARFAAAPTVMAASNKGLGQARALMFVGAGAFVAGAIIGGDAGTIVMVGGAVVGLYGLYEYLK